MPTTASDDIDILEKAKRLLAPDYVPSEDEEYMNERQRAYFRMLLIDGQSASGGAFVLQGESGADIFRAVLATGRCHWMDTDTPSLREGLARMGKATWTISESGTQRVVFEAEPSAHIVLPFSPPWYVDT